MSKRSRRRKPKVAKSDANAWRKGEPHALAQHVLQQAQLRRLALGYPQLVVDEAAGFQSGMTGKYEAAERIPSLQFLAYWAQALGCIIALVPLPGDAHHLSVNFRGHRHDDLAPYLRDPPGVTQSGNKVVYGRPLPITAPNQPHAKTT